MNSQSPLSGRTILLLAIAAALAPAATAAPLADSGFGWTEMLGVVNGPTYDPFNAPVPRRRPGYPVPPPPVFPVINPDAVGPAPVDQVGEFQVMTSNEKDYLATRVAFEFDLRGPALLAALWAWLVAVVFPMLVWGMGARWPLGIAFPF